MKKISLIFMLIVLFGGLCFAGCNDKNSETVIVSGFNDYYDLQKVEWADFIGKSELNTDKKYITEGESSSKTTIMYETDAAQEGADAVRSKNPSLKFRTAVYGEPLTDISKISSFSIDIFNAEDREIEVIFYVQKEDNTYVAADGAKLYPGSWNYLCFDTRAHFFEEGENVKQYILTIFDDGKYREDSLTIYFDNCRVTTSKTEAPGSSGEFLVFDSEDKISLVMPSAKVVPAVYTTYSEEEIFEGQTGCMHVHLRSAIKSIYDVAEAEEGYCLEYCSSLFAGKKITSLKTRVYNDGTGDLYVSLCAESATGTVSERVLVKAKTYADIRIEGIPDQAKRIFLSVENWNILSQGDLYVGSLIRGE